MHSSTFFTVFALATVVVAAPVPNDKPAQPSWPVSTPPSWTKSDLCSGSNQIAELVGSPFCNGNGNGNGNSAGNGNVGNGNDNLNGNGDKNGNGNTFGNGNNIGSGNSGLKIGRNDKPTESFGDIITGLVGSPFGNGNGNGNGNSAGNGNKDNGNGNLNGNGAGNGNGNTFGNGNNIGSGNNGFSLGRRSQKVRDLPDGAFSLIPDQTLTSLNKDFSQVFTDGPKDVVDVIEGAATGDLDNKFATESKRQVLTGLEDIIAQDIASYIP